MRVTIRMVLNDMSILSFDVNKAAQGETYSSDDSLCLVATILADEPAWRFNDPPKTKNLNETGQCLEKRRDSPRPGVHNTESTVGCPSSYDGTEAPQRVVDTDHGCLLRRECQLHDQDRCCRDVEAQPKANDASRRDKHAIYECQVPSFTGRLGLDLLF
jgi:hypothetical protein